MGCYLFFSAPIKMPVWLMVCCTVHLHLPQAKNWHQYFYGSRLIWGCQFKNSLATVNKWMTKVLPEHWIAASLGALAGKASQQPHLRGTQRRNGDRVMCHYFSEAPRRCKEIKRIQHYFHHPDGYRRFCNKLAKEAWTFMGLYWLLTWDLGPHWETITDHHNH